MEVRIEMDQQKQEAMLIAYCAKILADQRHLDASWSGRR